jgi:DNA-binding MurR/RpiR family transcriptional regulator
VLKQVYPTLPIAEKQVADFIAENLHKALFMTIKEIACAVGVSEGTVVRLAQRCGFSGFSEFKIQLAVDYETDKSIFQTVEPATPFRSSIQTLFETHIRTLEMTYRELPVAVLEQVVHAILNARKIHLYAVGSSGYVALDAAHKLGRMNLPAWGFTDPHTQLAMAAMMSRDGVVIGISHSGMTRDTIESVQLAKNNGAVTVAITSQPRSPLARIVDHVLPTSVREPVLQSGSVAARIAQLAVVDAITVGIHVHRGEQSNRLFKQTSSAVIGRKTGENFS